MLRKVKVQPTQSGFDMPDEPMKRSRFVRLIPNVLLRTSSSEKVCIVNDEIQLYRDGSGEFEPSSVCLAKMVQNFMEDTCTNDKNEEKTCSIPVRCGRRKCNCFNGVDDDDSSGDEPDCFAGCFGDSNHNSDFDAADILKSLVPCGSVVERKLLADTAKIVEKNNMCKERAEGFRNFVTDGLVTLGYATSICKSRWEKTTSFPAGEYEYIDVVHAGERLLIDIDFRSVFEIARSTKAYKTVLQTLPVIFVGKPDRLEKIVSTVTDAAKLSLKKRGLHFPPWRKAEYVKLKWLAPFTRTPPTPEPSTLTAPNSTTATLTPKSSLTDSELPTADDEHQQDLVFPFPENDDHLAKAPMTTGTIQVVGKEWNPKPPQSAIKSKMGFKVVTGLSSIMKG